MNRIIFILLLLSILTMIAVSQAQTRSDSITVAPKYQYGDHTCYDAEIKLLKFMTADDPMDAALPGMKIQVEAYATLFEEQQTC